MFNLVFCHGGQKLLATWGLALVGHDVETSAVTPYQLQFQLDVNNLALVHIFNF